MDKRSNKLAVHAATVQIPLQRKRSFSPAVCDRFVGEVPTTDELPRGRLMLVEGAIQRFS